MVGEEFGWVPLDGWTIAFLIFGILLVVMIPGFLLSLALFPKRAAMAMSERLALSFGLGLTPPFILQILNMSLGLRVNLISSIMVAVAIIVVSFFGFLNRGGNINLVEWYKESS
jgi:uncharacterized membrane protein